MPKKKIFKPDDLFDTRPVERTAVEKSRFIASAPGQNIYRTIRAVSWQERKGILGPLLDFPHADRFTFESKAILERKLMMGQIELPDAEDYIDPQCIPAEIIPVDHKYREHLYKNKLLDEFVDSYQIRKENYGATVGYIKMLRDILMVLLEQKLIPIYKYLQIPYPSKEAEYERKGVIYKHRTSKIIKAIAHSSTKRLIAKGPIKRDLNLDPKHLIITAFTTQLGELLEIRIFETLTSMGIYPYDEDFELERNRFLKRYRNSKILQHFGSVPKPKKLLPRKKRQPKKTKKLRDYNPQPVKREKPIVEVARQITSKINKRILTKLKKEHNKWISIQPKKYSDLLETIVIENFSQTFNLTIHELAEIWSWVYIPEDVTKCWEWRGNFYTLGEYAGYGQIMHYPAHKLIYMMYMKDYVNIDLEVYHKCNNRICVNPNHMIFIPL